MKKIHYLRWSRCKCGELNAAWYVKICRACGKKVIRIKKEAK